MMKETADKYGIDRSQIPILWAIAKGAVPIVGITKPSYAEKLSDALKIRLSAEDCTGYIAIIEREAKRPHEMKRHAQPHAEPTYRPRVLRDFGAKKDNRKTMLHIYSL